jgi:hypothetical protein
MAIQTTTEILTRAQGIKNETVEGANTAVRVGSLIEDFADSIDPITGHCWQHYGDSIYTSASKLSIAAGIRTKLTNDGILRNIVSPNGYPPIWNTTTNKITPLAEHDFYTFRLDMKGWSDIASTNHFDIEINIGGAVGVLTADTAIFIKGATTEQNFNFSSHLFVGSTFIANGGEIYITPESAASFWDIGLTISRTYTPKV